MKKISLAFLTFFFLSTAFSQVPGKDSLLNVIKSGADSSAKLRAYLQLSSSYHNFGELKESIFYSKKAVALSKKLMDTTMLIQAFVDLGHDYSSQGITNIAISQYYEALKLSEQVNDTVYISQLYSALGSELTKEREFEKARFYLENGLKKSLAGNRKITSAGFYNNLGILARNQGKYDEASSYYFKAIELCKEMRSNRTMMQTYNNLGYISELKGNMVEAMEYYNNSLQLALQLKDKFQEEIVAGNIGSIYQRAKDYTIAEKYFLQALKIAEEIDDIEGKVTMYEGLASINERLKRYEKCLDYWGKHIEVKKVYDRSNNELERKREQIKYEYEKDKIALIKEQEKHDLVATAERKKQIIIIYAVSIGFIIVAILLGFIYKRFKITNKQKVIIENQKKLVEEKQKEILDSISYAKRIQDSLLDNFDSVNKFFSGSFVLNKPKDIVSGDFYWLTKKITTEKINSDESMLRELFFIAVCDSTGHGVPGGFMSLLNTAYLSEAINEKNIFEPDKILDYVRNRLVNTISKNDQKDGFDGVLLCFEKKFHYQKKTLTKTDMQLTYASAHNAPLIISKNNLTELRTDKMPVGYWDKSQNFTLFTHPVAENDVIYAFTDGYADQFGGEKGKKFMYKQLYDLLLINSNLSMQEQKEILDQKFTEWKRDLEQIDDVLIVGIKV